MGSWTMSTLEIKTCEQSAWQTYIKQGNLVDWHTCRYYFQLRYDSQYPILRFNHKARFQTIFYDIDIQTFFLQTYFPRKGCLIMVLKRFCSQKNKHGINNLVDMIDVDQWIWYLCRFKLFYNITLENIIFSQKIGFILGESHVAHWLDNDTNQEKDSLSILGKGGSVSAPNKLFAFFLF